MCSECLKREDGYMHRDDAVDEYIYDHDLDVDVNECGFLLKHEYTHEDKHEHAHDNDDFVNDHQIGLLLAWIASAYLPC